MLNLAVLLEESAKRYPDKDAFIMGTTHLTYAQTNAAANKIANGLASLGIGPGDKVALSCLNLPYFPMVYYGILKLGAVVVPLSVLLKKDEVAYHLSNADVKAYFCFSGTPELPMGKEGHAGFLMTPLCEHFILITTEQDTIPFIADVLTMDSLLKDAAIQFKTAATGAEDTALIIHTSGTTGKPKGAELTHSNLLQNAILSQDLFKLTAEDRLLIVLPLFHIFGMTCLMNAGVYRGTTNILLPKFDAGIVLQLMLQHKISVFAGVPTMYWGLLNYKGKAINHTQIADNIRICVAGGASLPLQVLNEFEEKFNVPILEGYGMSEGSPVVTFNQLTVGKKAGSIGKAIWGVSVKLIDTNGQEVPVGEKGELLYKGHNVMKGYYKQAEATKKALKDGWMHSGDIAMQDADGFFYIVDRTKDMIIRGGLNVYPREVEEVIMKHQAVSLVAVIGVPNDKFGEEIMAYVVLKERQSLSETALKEWTKAHIAAYKYPRIIQFTDSLPMSATGKILKKELRKLR